jgi:transposase
MLTLPSTVRIYVAAEPVDLRRGFDGLAAATREIIRADPLSGHLFVYTNRRSNRLKILLWEPSGYLMLYKRLERGRFRIPMEPRAGARHVELEATELALMMEGIDLRDAKRRPRWTPREKVLAHGAPI